MGLTIKMDGKAIEYWKASNPAGMTEDEAAEIATEVSEELDAYVDDLLIMGKNKFVAILVRNE